MNPLTPNIMHLFNPEPVRVANRRATDDITGGFGNILTEAFTAVDDTDAADKASTLQLLTGQADDLSGLMIDIQKADLALQLALQIRNKLIDAYNEVMRMNV